MAKRGLGAKQLRHSEVLDRNSAFDFNIDLIASLDRNEKIFQKKMKRIFEKYNKPFEDDVVLTMEDLSCIGENEQWNVGAEHGRKKNVSRRYTKNKGSQKPTESKYSRIAENITYGGSEGLGLQGDSEGASKVIEHSKVSGVICSNNFIDSDDDSSELLSEDSNNGQLVTSKTVMPLVHFSDTRLGKTYIADTDILLDLDESVSSSKIFVQCQDHNGLSVNFSPVKVKQFPRADDLKGSRMEISQRYLENQNSFVKSPSKDVLFTQIKQFIGRHNNASNLNCTVTIQSEKCERETDDEDADDEESNASDLGNVSLADYYPNMIECLSRLMDLPRKKVAASNIIRYYRHHFWFASKHKLDITKAKRAMWKPRCLKMTANSNLNDGKISPSVFFRTKGLGSWVNDDLNKSGFIECGKEIVSTGYQDTTQILDLSKSRLHRDSVLSQTIIINTNETKNPVQTKPFIHNANKTFTFNESTRHTVPEQWRQKNELAVRLPHPSSALLRSCFMEKSPSKLSIEAWMAKHQAKKEEVNSRVCCSPNRYRLVKQPLEAQSSLRRRHSFSTFPSQQRSVQSPADSTLTFEALYKKLISDDSCKSLFRPTEHLLSETVNALVYSPGSIRSKRGPSDEWSVSKMKRSRISEHFVNYQFNKISTFSPMTNASDLLQHQDSRLHQTSHSSLPMSTWPHYSSMSGASNKQQCSGSPKCLNISNSSDTFNRINTSVYRKLNYTYDSESITTNKRLYEN